MNRTLDALSSRFRPIAMALIARAIEADIPVLIVNTRRTELEQEINISNGTSWTKQSKHLIGDAIDIAPYEVYQLHGADKLEWDADDPVWEKLGLIGENLGLVWGGRWKQRDLGHFELKILPPVPKPANL